MVGSATFEVPQSVIGHFQWQPHWGSTYIEVDIGRQHMWYFINGQLVLNTPVVTGLPPHWATPRGTFYIMWKASPTVLVGPTWRAPVSYWMQITSSGVGFHDATWQPWFGGSRYLTNGSHGCINMPLGAAAELYRRAANGTKVIIH